MGSSQPRSSSKSRPKPIVQWPAFIILFLCALVVAFMLVPSTGKWPAFKYTSGRVQNGGAGLQGGRRVSGGGVVEYGIGAMGYWVDGELNESAPLQWLYTPPLTWPPVIRRLPAILFAHLIIACLVFLYTLVFFGLFIRASRTGDEKRRSGETYKITHHRHPAVLFMASLSAAAVVALLIATAVILSQAWQGAERGGNGFQIHSVGFLLPVAYGLTVAWYAFVMYLVYQAKQKAKADASRAKPSSRTRA